MMKKTIFYTLIFVFLWLFPQNVNGQEITLEQCYQWTKENHPLSGKSDLLKTQNEWELQALQAQKYPQFTTEAQATYQSEVVSLPITLPNINIESPDKDQYKATLTAGQLIYNGGLIQTQKNLKKSQLAAAEKEIEVQLHDLKNQINTLYFNILLLQQKDKIIIKNKKLLQDKKVELQKMIEAGTAFESMVEPVEIKLLELEQSIAELSANKTQLWEQLNTITGKKLSINTQLLLPDSNINTTNKRVEFELFDLQAEMVNTQSDLLKKQTLPHITAFGTVGYGKPGLNLLDNSWQDYYMAGLKLQWNAFDFGANKKQRQAIAINKDIIANQKQIFEWQQDLTIQNLNAEYAKYETIIAADKKIIAYRERMLETAEKKLKHDLITPADYTQAVSDLQDAEINLKTHEIQRQLTLTNLNTTLYD